MRALKNTFRSLITQIPEKKITEIIKSLLEIILSIFSDFDKIPKNHLIVLRTTTIFKVLLM